MSAVVPVAGFVPLGFAALSGSGMAATQSLYGFFVEPATALGTDPKEVGAFVAWLTYGGFLHTRISRGWTGRSSAYFALVAFLLIIFTYLGVSYLLPGLHSYA